MRRSLVYLGSTAMVAMLAAQPVMAQEAKPQKSEVQGIAEIVVTAQKYEQSLQKTPISIVTVDAKQIKSLGVDSLGGFDAFLPNVSIGGTMGQGNAIAAFSIRGIGGAASGFVTQESSVGVYIDDVLYARPNGGLLDLLDIERIEVLRGPQGTLFGRNTAGGAIRYVTKRPDFKGVSGNITAQAGSRNMLNINGNLNIPLTDNLAIRASFSSKTLDGYVHRIVDNTYTGAENSKVGRLQVRWQPTSRLDINLSGDWIRSTDNGSATITRDFSVTDQYINNFYANSTIGTQARRLAPVNTLPNLANNLTTGGTYAGYSTAAADIGYYQGKINGKYEVYGGNPDLNKLDSAGFASNIAYKVTDDITLKSLTGYRSLKQIQNQDFDRTPLPFYNLNEKINIEYVTQEFQLVGNSFNNRLKWVAGAFYYWEHADDFRRRLGGSDVSDSSYANDLTTIDPLTTGLGLGALESKRETTKSLAFFGQGTFKVTDKLDVTAGLRYTKDTKNYIGFRENRGRVCVAGTTITAVAGGTCAPGSTITSVAHTNDGSWEDWSPRASINYQWTPTVMTYVSASRGFKGGGFNDTLGTNCAATTLTVCGLSQYLPETLWTYEAGVRSDLFDRRVRLNLTGFYVKYHNLQIQYIDPGPPPIQYTLNGDSTIKGLEADLFVAPVTGLVLHASLGYTDSKYDNDVVNNAGVVKIEKAVPYFRSPKWSYTLGANYVMDMPGDGTMTFDVNYGWKASQASTAIPTNAVILPSFGILNGRIEYKSKSGWSLAAFGKNLTNTYYYTSAFDPGGPSSKPSVGSTLPHDAVFGYGMYDLGAPRSYGVELSYKF